MDKMEPLSGLWTDLLKSGGLPTHSVLQSNCEAELTHLMQQIDGMVQAKITELHHERQLMQAKLDAVQQECTRYRATVEQKNREISHLRSQMDVNDKGRRKVVEGYEQQFQTLQNQVGVMRKRYEKLKKQLQENNKANEDAAESSSELHKLSKKLDDYRQRAKDWEHQKQTLLKKLETHKAENKMLQETHQAQIKKIQEEAQSTIKLNTKELETQLAACKTQLDAEMKLTKEQLDATLQKTWNSECFFRDEIASLREMLNSSRHDCELLNKQMANKLENRLTQVTTSNDHHLQQQEREISHLNATLHERNSQLENMRLQRSALKATIKELEQALGAKMAEVHASNAQKEALALENQQALRSTLPSVSQTADYDDSREEDPRAVAALKALQQEVAQLKAEKSGLRENLDSRSKKLTRLGLEHDAMKNFVGGVQEVVLRQPRRENSILLSNSLTPDESLEDMMLDPVEAVTEQFLLLQEERTQELERKLDQHIEGLKASMEHFKLIS